MKRYLILFVVSLLVASPAFAAAYKKHGTGGGSSPSGDSSPERTWTEVSTIAALESCAEAGGAVGCYLNGSVTSTVGTGAVRIDLPNSWTDILVQCASPTIDDAILWNPTTPIDDAVIFRVDVNVAVENSHFTIQDCYIQEQRGGIPAGSDTTVEGLFLKGGGASDPRVQFNIIDTIVEVFSWQASTVACGQNPTGNGDMSMARSFCRGAIAYDSKLSTSGTGRTPRSFIEDSKLYAQPSHFAEGGALASGVADAPTSTTVLTDAAGDFVNDTSVGDIVFLNYGTEFEQWAEIASRTATTITFVTELANSIGLNTEYRIDASHGNTARAIKVTGNGSLDSYRNEYKHGYIDVDTEDGSRLSFRSDSFDIGPEQTTSASFMQVLNAPFINLDDIVIRGQLGNSAPVFMYFASGGGGYFRMNAYVENCNEWWKAGGGGKLLRANSAASIPEFFVTIQGAAGCELQSDLWHADGGVGTAMLASETDGSIAFPRTQSYTWIRDGVEESAPGPFGQSHNHQDETRDTAANIGTLTEVELRGRWFFVTSGTDTITLPEITESGNGVCFYAVSTDVVTLDVDATDEFVIDGVAGTAGATMVSDGTVGSYVCMISNEVGGNDQWITLGKSGVWSAGS